LRYREARMSKRGRPPKAPEDKRSKRIPVWVTPSEWDALAELANATNCTKSELLMEPHRDDRPKATRVMLTPSQVARLEAAGWVPGSMALSQWLVSRACGDRG
jgi:hypothetical protein